MYHIAKGNLLDFAKKACYVNGKIKRSLPINKKQRKEWQEGGDRESGHSSPTYGVEVGVSCPIAR